MTPAEAKARHAKLAEEISRLDHAYHVEGQQFIIEGGYEQISNQLFSELHKLEKQFPSAAPRATMARSRTSRELPDQRRS